MCVLYICIIVVVMEEFFDDESVWVVMCFVVCREYCGFGFNFDLFCVVVFYVCELGVCVIEGYLVDICGEW